MTYVRFLLFIVFFFKQKPASELRISDCGSDVCSSDLYSAVIAYRRELGPPPGFLLLERRSYYNRDCERSAEQAYFNRLFIPVPNPPLREACTDLASVVGAQGAGSDAPGFVRISEAFALLPEAFSPSYQGLAHRSVLTLFA